VGAGVIGCEMLKNWALMGVGCGPTGKIHITDMDRIEKSNLSRQFLFCSKHINHFKSACAAEAAKDMNSAINIQAYQEKVGEETEHIFGDNFYDKLTGVCTALDNVEARLYVDQKCEDAEMRNHFDFIVAASNLRASMYGIKGRTDEDYFVQVLKDVMIPDLNLSIT